MNPGDEKTGQSRPKLCPCYERRDSKRDFSNPPLMKSDLRAQEFQGKCDLDHVLLRSLGLVILVVILLAVTSAGPSIAQQAARAGSSIVLPKARPEIVQYNRLWYGLYFG